MRFVYQIGWPGPPATIRLLPFSPRHVNGTVTPRSRTTHRPLPRKSRGRRGGSGSLAADRWAVGTFSGGGVAVWASAAAGIRPAAAIAISPHTHVESPRRVAARAFLAPLSTRRV